MILKKYARAQIPKKYRIYTNTTLFHRGFVGYSICSIINMDSCEWREYKYTIRLIKCVKEINI